MSASAWLQPSTSMVSCLTNCYTIFNVEVSTFDKMANTHMAFVYDYVRMPVPCIHSVGMSNSPLTLVCYGNAPRKVVRGRVSVLSIMTKIAISHGPHYGHKTQSYLETHQGKWS